MKKATWLGIVLMGIRLLAVLVVLVFLPAMAASASPPPNHPVVQNPYPIGDPCGDDIGCVAGGTDCGPCTSCYWSAYNDYKSKLQGCAALGNQPGCEAGVRLGYESRKQYCEQLCDEGNCPAPTLPSDG